MATWAPIWCPSTIRDKINLPNKNQEANPRNICYRRDLRAEIWKIEPILSFKTRHTCDSVLLSKNKSFLLLKIKTIVTATSRSIWGLRSNLKCFSEVPNNLCFVSFCYHFIVIAIVWRCKEDTYLGSWSKVSWAKEAMGY